MHSFIIYCPHLNRDVRGLLNAVPNPRIWTGEKTPVGADGCLQCHHAIVKLAQEQHWPCVFVMEDDCMFTTYFEWSAWEWYARRARDYGFDVLVGGCTRTYDEKCVWVTEGRGLIEVSAFHSAHCTLYFESSYQNVLKTSQPLDLSIGRQGAKVALTWPFVAVQRASFSGILQQRVNYEPLYAAHEARLGHALGLLDPFIPMPVY